ALLPLVVVLLVGIPSSAVAAIFYVSVSTGLDSNPGTIGSPFQTINHGVSVLSAGDTLLVRAGTYPETLDHNIPSGTSWSNKVRIAAYPGTGVGTEIVWLRPTSVDPSSQSIISLGSPGTYRYIEFDGINLDGSALPSGTAAQSVHLEASSSGTGTDHIRFQNLESIGATGANIFPGGPIHFGLFSVDATVATSGYHEFINLRVHGGGSGGGFAYGFYIAQ